jgi:hypothetical protein
MNEHYLANKPRRLELARKRYRAIPSAKWTPERRARANLSAKRQRAKWWRTVLDHYGRRCACCGEREVLCHEDVKASCCTRDGGRPSGAALQEEAPNRHEPLRSKAAVVNVMVKRRGMTASGVDERDERK